LLNFFCFFVLLTVTIIIGSYNDFQNVQSIWKLLHSNKRYGISPLENNSRFSLFGCKSIDRPISGESIRRAVNATVACGASEIYFAKFDGAFFDRPKAVASDSVAPPETVTCWQVRARIISFLPSAPISVRRPVPATFHSYLKTNAK